MVFKAVDGFQDQHMELACGQCMGCRVARSQAWAIRAFHEAQMHERNCFITLTYDEVSLPDDWSLDVRHWQMFAKRLRKAHGAFRFLHCGEYGELEGGARPHYHALLFGVDFFEDRIPWDGGGFTSESLTKIWGKGLATVDVLNWTTASYVASYVTKKLNGEMEEKYLERLDPTSGLVWSVKSEYMTQSRRPGLGAKWLKKYLKEVYPSDEVVANGKTFGVPKFYDQLLEELDEDLFLKVRGKRMKRKENDQRDRSARRLFTKDEVLKANAQAKGKL